MPETRKVMMTPTLEAVRQECFATGRGFGNRLTEILERYGALIEGLDVRCEFDSDEWHRVCEVLRERWPQPDTATEPAHLSEIFRQAGEHDLAHGISRMDLWETTVLLEEVQRDLSKQAEKELVE